MPDQSRKKPVSQPPGGGRIELAPRVWVDADAVDITYVRSGGPGGQNVNKRSTKARLRLAIAAIPIGPLARARLGSLAGANATEDGQLVISSDRYRSQSRNRQACFDRLRELIVQARHVPKARKRTEPTRAARERRLTEKKQRGAIKKHRRPPEH